MSLDPAELEDAQLQGISLSRDASLCIDYTVSDQGGRLVYRFRLPSDLDDCPTLECGALGDPPARRPSLLHWSELPTRLRHDALPWIVKQEVTASRTAHEDLSKVLRLLRDHLESNLPLERSSD